MLTLLYMKTFLPGVCILSYCVQFYVQSLANIVQIFEREMFGVPLMHLLVKKTHLKLEQKALYLLFFSKNVTFPCVEKTAKTYLKNKSAKMHITKS